MTLDARSLAQTVTPLEWKDAVVEPVDKPLTNLFCYIVYGIALAAYGVFAVVMWATAPDVVTYKSQEVVDFGPVAITISVHCPSCNVHASGDLWRVVQNYTGFAHCAEAGLAPVVQRDLNDTVAQLCRTTDNIVDKSGVRVWVGNMTLHAKRASLVISDSSAALEVTTPLEAWHEKTLILGMTVKRDKEDCTSASECSLSRELYLASMQYDGKVDWGGETWAGGQLNVRMLRFASVYTTVPKQSWMDVLASMGGASGVLLGICGMGVKFLGTMEDRFLGKRQAASPNAEA